MKQNNIKEEITKIIQKLMYPKWTVPLDKDSTDLYVPERNNPDWSGAIEELTTLIDKVREEGKIEAVKGIRSGIQSASYKHPQIFDVLNAIVLTLNTLLEELEKRVQSLKGDKD